MLKGILWQSIYLVALIAGIPGLTYFTQTSLRRLNPKVIDPNEEYTYLSGIWLRYMIGRDVSVVNGIVVCKYRKRLGMSREYHSLKDFVNVLWQFGMLAFGVYFTYFFYSK